jgi:Acetyl-CoA acetyltransferase
MRRVYIAGASLVKVDEYWGESLDSLVSQLADGFSGLALRKIDAVYVANMLGEVLQSQANLGALVAEDLGLAGVAAFRVEAGEASGLAALHAGYQSIRAGLADTVLVLGVEKLSDASPEEAMATSSLSERYDYVGFQGVPQPAIASMMYNQYLKRFEVPQEMVAQFPVMMHEHAAKSPHSQYQFKITLESVLSSPFVSEPLRRLECAGIGDGAAAVLLCSSDALSTIRHDEVVELAGSACSTDIVFPFDREDPLRLGAASRAFEEALARAGVARRDIRVLEIHDSYSILACLLLESIGLSEPGRSGVDLKKGKYSLAGEVAVNTFGGLKARGHPAGATGVYQAAEVYLQLTGRAGECQVDGAKVGAALNLAGLGSCVFASVMKVRDV